MRIIPECQDYFGFCKKDDVSENIIFTNKQELIEETVNKYLGKYAYKDEPIRPYYHISYLDGYYDIYYDIYAKEHGVDEKDARCDLLEIQERYPSPCQPSAIKCQDGMCKRKYIKHFIEDDVFIILASSLDIFENTFYVKDIYFVFKNRSVLNVKKHANVDQGKVYYDFLTIRELEKCFPVSYLYNNTYASYSFRVIYPLGNYRAELEIYNSLMEFLGTTISNGKLVKFDKEYWLKYSSKSRGYFVGCCDESEETRRLNALVTNYDLDINGGDFNTTYTMMEEYDGVLVIRLLRVKNETELVEISRIFITNNSVVVMRNEECYGFVRLTKQKDILQLIKDYKVPKSEVKNIGAFKYELEALEENGFEDSEISVKTLVMIKESKIVEQLSKAGLGKFVIYALKLADKNNISLDTIMKIHFGELGPATSIYSYLGINKYQIEKLKTVKEYSSPEMIGNKGASNMLVHIRMIKYILSMDNIQPLDNKTFDMLFDWLEKYNQAMRDDNHLKKLNTGMVAGNVTICCERKYHILIQSMHLAYKYFGQIKTAFDYIVKIKQDVPSAEVDINIFTIILYVSEMKQWRMYDKNPFRGMLSKNVTANDVENLYLKIHALWDAASKKHDDELMQAQNKKWKHLLYENEEYCVIAPNSEKDFAKEAITLNHCVNSYVDKVREGKKIILFIRRKQRPNAPFFTAELTKDNVIKQVHGRNNRNVDEVYGLMGFIVEWAHERKLTIGRIDNLYRA